MECINGKTWTTHDINYLLSNYKSDNLNEIAVALNRSANSVRSKAIRLGIHNRQRTARFWTREETNYLEDNYPTQKAEEIAVALNRSVDSVKRKAQSMNIETEYISFMTSAYVARAFGTTISNVGDWINRHNLKAKKCYRGKMVYYQLKENVLWEWAREHSKLINWAKLNLEMFTSIPKWAVELKKECLTPCHRNNITTKEISSIKKDYHNCLPISKIAQKYGRTEYAIKHIVNM